MSYNKVMPVISVSRPGAISSGKVEKKKVSWNQIVDYYSKPKQCPISLKEYYARNSPIVAKDQGAFLFGAVRGNTRNAKDVTNRCCFNYDLDGADFNKVVARLKSMNTNFICHTTFKSTDEEQRVRIIIPLKENLKPIEGMDLQNRFRFLSRCFMDKFLKDFPNIDVKSFDCQQVMFCPNVPKGETYHFFHESSKGFYDWHPLEKEYENLKDLGPHGWPKTIEQIAQEKEKASRPIKSFSSYSRLSNGSIIADYNAAHDCPSVMAKFASHIYFPADETGLRYGVQGSHSPAGVIYDPNKNRIFSFHSHRDKLGDGHAHSPFDIMKEYGFNGDMKAALQFAQMELGKEKG